jgi:hypothetical protein
VRELDAQLLSRFENGLDPRHPEASPIPARVLGYGEISTVFEIDAPGASGWALKRMPMFRDEHEAEAYATLYRRYVATLTNEVGLAVAPGKVVRVDSPGKGHVTLYIAQQKLSPEAIGHRVIQKLSHEEVVRLVCAALAEMRKVFEFNRLHQGALELGLDGQISNWCIQGFEPASGRLPEPLELVYLDTSTPLMRVNGKEQLDPELLLRSAPSFLLWLVRRAFLPEVMTRYYDFRRVAIDLVANFYKEGRPELVPTLVETVNDFFTEGEGDHAAPLTVKEIEDYYRFDALIWRVYLALRKLDRMLARAGRREYPYILPGKIER